MTHVDIWSVLLEYDQENRWDARKTTDWPSVEIKLHQESSFLAFSRVGY